MNELETLKLAFAVSAAQSIVDADGVRDYGELSLFGQVFPRSLLRDAGFLDDEGSFTSAFDEARKKSLSQLPEALEESEKLDLLTLLHGHATADGALDPAEIAKLQEAAGLLGLSAAQWMAHLAQD